MDSPPSPDSRLGPPAGSPEVEAPPGALARLRRLLPLVRGVVRQTRRLAVVSTLAAVALWGVVVEPWTWGASPPLGGYGLALLGLAVLLVPAGAALLGASTLAGLLDLPAQLRETAREGADHARGALAKPDEEERGGRVFRFARAVWSIRALVTDAQGGWLKALAVARLASLPFALALIGAVMLNFAVIAAGALAVLIALL